jgi:D-alanyl-D-alanine carboxypeptidase/D-alanyl-D-alanine-endopeptidase (penicillin-binding protein 4)
MPGRTRSPSKRPLTRLLLALALAAWLVPAASPAGAQEPASPGTVDQVVRELAASERYRHADLGVAFWSLDGDSLVYARRADRLFTPASTTKLLTEATALEVLGPEHRFRTRVYRTGPVTEGGTLEGDLVLVASGDPNLSGRIRAGDTLAFTDHDHAYGGSPETEAVDGDPLAVIREMAQQVASAGVRRVEGRVVVDATLFPGGDREQGSQVVISPVMVNDNVVDVTVRPGPAEGDPVRLEVSPATAYADFVVDATTGPSDADPEIRWGEDRKHADGSRTVTVEGTFPAGHEPILYAYDVPEPVRFAEFVLSEALQEQGIVAPLRPADVEPDTSALSGSYVDGNVVAEHVSPPLVEESKVTLKVSQNLHASAKPYLLGALRGGDVPRPGGDGSSEGSPSDTMTVLERGFALEHRFLTEAGLDVSGASQGDGAGGDRAAFYTPSFMVRFLDHMADRPYFDEYRDALPVLGRDGTLSDVQTDAEAAGHVQAKTGTYVVPNPLNGSFLLTAKGLAGYLTTEDGEDLAFALYVNRVPLDGDLSDAVEEIGQALGGIAAAAYRLPFRASTD